MLRLRLSKRTGAIPCQGYPGDRNWFNPWGQVSRGRPDKVESLFSVIAEKIPFECLDDIKRDVKATGLESNGIYLAHDSMGAVRYAGRGNIFKRLSARKNARPLELVYFSFYIIPNNKHEREVETVVIRTASHILTFNERKKRPTITPGNVSDYEPGTVFYERQKKPGPNNGRP